MTTTATGLPVRCWASLDPELAMLQGWAGDHHDEAMALVDRIAVGCQRRETALIEGDTAAVTAIDKRIAELRLLLLALDTNVRMLFAVRVALFARSLLGECELNIRAVAPDGVVVEFAVAP